MNCENCDIEHNGEYGSGRFCSKKCSKSFSTKNKRKEINEKVSIKLTKNILNKKNCIICNKEFLSNKKCCSSKCGSIYGGLQNKKDTDIFLNCIECDKSFKTKFNKRFQKFCCNLCKNNNKEYKEKISNIAKIKCSTIEEKNRLREIGRKGGFGKKGYTDKNIYYQSTLEKNCFEYLDLLNIEYEPHKNIPKSSKISDIYLIKHNLWIELDGIDRDKKAKWIGKDYDYWLEKLKLYKTLNLNLVIIKKFKEFKEFIKKI